MKTIEIKNAKRPLAEYANSVGDAVLVVKNGKPLAVLSSARGMDAESIALANSPKFAAIIERSRARHAKEGGISIQEVRRRLGLKPRPPRRNGATASARGG
jgi:hypothetical protein